MTTQDKLFFCKTHGISLTYIAQQAEIAPATLTKWMRGEKGITEKNHRHIDIALLNFAKEIWQQLGDNNDRNI